MLRITGSKNSGNSGAKYFSEGLVRGDYYLPEDEKTIGRWYGKMTERLGLKEGQEISKKEFVNLLNNRTPIEGEKLNPRDGGNNKRSYWDMTFSVPKSVSLLMQFGEGGKGDEKIKIAIEESVKETMAEMEEKVHYQQGRNKEMIPSKNWVYASFTHSKTRPVLGVPQMHTHVHALVMNSTWNEEKQRFQAPELNRVVRNAPYFEAVFDSRLASRLKAEGYPIERRGLSFEIVGVRDDLLKKFSARTAQIEKATQKEEAKHGVLTAKQKSQIGARSREKKEASILSGKVLKSHWQEQMTESEWEQIMGAKGREPINKTTSANLALARAESHLFERKSAALEYNHIRRTALQKSFGDVLPEQLDGAIKEAGYHQRVRGGRSFMTTPQALKREQKMLAFVRASKGVKKPIDPNFEISNPILNKQQREAIDFVVKQSNDRVMMISGRAGVGKTTMMRQVQRAVKGMGGTFYALAPTSKAANDLLPKEGFEKTATVAQLLHNPKLQEQVKEAVLWVDEATLLDLKSTNELFAICEKQNARVIFTGDAKQHSSVKSGDAMRIIEKEGGLKVSRVYEIQRQRNNPRYKRVVELAASGKTDKALYQLDKIGGVIQIKDESERLNQLVKDYSKVIKAGKSAMILSPTRAEGRQVTKAVREFWKENGQITDERPWSRLQQTGWTEEEKRDDFSYREAKKDLVIEFHQNAKRGFMRGSVWQVVKGENQQLMIQQGKERKALPFDLANRFTVYEKRAIALGVGDKIRVTKNTKSKNGTHLQNGMVYRIEGFNRHGDMKLHTGKYLAKDFSHLDYGIVTTSVSSQGSTVSEVFISQANQTLASSKSQFYVSISRARNRARIYTDNKKDLEKAVMRDESRMTAREIANDQEWEMAQSQTVGHQKEEELDHDQQRGQGLSI